MGSWNGDQKDWIPPSRGGAVDTFAAWMVSKDTGAALTPIDWTDEVTVRLTYQF